MQVLLISIIMHQAQLVESIQLLNKVYMITSISMYVAEIAFLMTTFRSAQFSSPSSMKCSQTFQTQRDCRLLKKKNYENTVIEFAFA